MSDTPKKAKIGLLSILVITLVLPFNAGNATFAENSITVEDADDPIKLAKYKQELASTTYGM